MITADFTSLALVLSEIWPFEHYAYFAYYYAYNRYHEREELTA